MSNRSEIGYISESMASNFLVRRGYDVLGRNYRKKWGEIDLIAKKGDTLFFVEVKSSVNAGDGFEPELRANQEKLKRVVRAARTYLEDKKYGPEQEWQIDVISINFSKGQGKAKIKHFRNVDVI